MNVTRPMFIVGDLLLAVFVVLCAPVVLIAIGLVVAFCVRALLWIVTAGSFAG
jgi:hypothetical protein